MRDILRNNEENDWKEILSETLKELGFIDEKFEGKILVQANSDNTIRNENRSSFTYDRFFSNISKSWICHSSNNSFKKVRLSLFLI